ncbi:MAG: hypothetical protein IKZ51_09655 [Bacteroidales bacterium]|nr:hypothetical protein [Bacteroidales bacterium]
MYISSDTLETIGAVIFIIILLLIAFIRLKHNDEYNNLLRESGYMDEFWDFYNKNRKHYSEAKAMRKYLTPKKREEIQQALDDKLAKERQQRAKELEEFEEWKKTRHS